METKPSEKGISVIETDLEVDFAPPLGYVEPDYRKTKASTSSASIIPPSTSIKEHLKEERTSFKSFNGSGNRLNGKVNTAGYGLVARIFVYFLSA
jgi:ubiquitin fusion degradation protein 1